MRRWLLTVAATVLVTGAGGPAVAQGGGWRPPECELDEGHYLIRGARTYIRQASMSKLEERRHLADAYRVLTEAMQEKGLDERAGVWYYLGRYYLFGEDYAGADSAFDRAEALSPQCADDIGFWRRRIWVPVLNRGVNALQDGQRDTAIHYFKLANTIYAGEPQAFIQLGSIYANLGEVDSAVHYFKRGVEAAGGRQEFAEDVELAQFNVARLYHRAERYDSAAAAYRRYLERDSTSIKALAGLAAVFAAQGKTEEATPLYDKIVLNTEGATALDLFAAGTALFQADAHERAAQAFELGLAKNPYHRDALYNLTNTYLTLKDGAKMLPVAQRLVEVDPLSAQALRLLAAAYQQVGQPDTTLAILQRIEAMPLTVAILSFTPEEQKATLLGQITNKSDKPQSGVKLQFEFLDEGGDVAATEEVAAEAISPGDAAGFRLTPLGEGIVSWRYTVLPPASG